MLVQDYPRLDRCGVDTGSEAYSASPGNKDKTGTESFQVQRNIGGAGTRETGQAFRGAAQLATNSLAFSRNFSPGVAGPQSYLLSHLRSRQGGASCVPPACVPVPARGATPVRPGPPQFPPPLIVVNSTVCSHLRGVSPYIIIITAFQPPSPQQRLAPNRLEEVIPVHGTMWRNGRR
ncbi:hypothetical protein Bbelb_256700 [Branchiostoma belcheri]|nr:hypothetical protein Bbelb_256700 [Branchiostoma belcheri]